MLPGEDKTKRMKRFELSTLSLARRCSTTELHPQEDRFRRAETCIQTGLTPVSQAWTTRGSFVNSVGSVQGPKPRRRLTAGSGALPREGLGSSCGNDGESRPLIGWWAKPLNVATRRWSRREQTEPMSSPPPARSRSHYHMDNHVELTLMQRANPAPLQSSDTNKAIR